MKRLLFSVSSLSLVAVACGGVVQRGRDDAAGASDGRGSASGSGGGGAPGMMTAGPGLPPSGKAGAPMTTPSSVGGSSPAFGGPTEGGDSGVGGGSTVRPPSENEAACRAHCVAYGKVCPELGSGDTMQCVRDCTDELERSDEACAIDRANAYECTAFALYQVPGDCAAALAYASKSCGTATAGVLACDETCLPSVSGDSTGCHATAHCGGADIDLHCFETNGSAVPCTCSIGSRGVWKLSTQFDTAKAACIDADLFRRCEAGLQ